MSLDEIHLKLSGFVWYKDQVYGINPSLKSRATLAAVSLEEPSKQKMTFMKTQTITF